VFPLHCDDLLTNALQHLPWVSLQPKSLLSNGYLRWSSLGFCLSSRLRLQLQSYLEQTVVRDKKVPLSVKTENELLSWTIIDSGSTVVFHL
jgi:hypothetical protein